MPRINVMQLIPALEFGGSERLAATISATLPRDRFNASVCGLFGGEGPLVLDLKRQGVPHFFQNAEKKSKLAVFYALYRLFRKQQIDVVQVHGAYGLMYCFLPAKLAGVKIIYTEHAKQSILRVRSVGIAARRLPGYVAKTICVSENLQTFFQDSLGVGRKCLQVIHNGIDASRFRNDSQPFPEKAAHITIGCVARLTEAKDHANLLTAFSRVIAVRTGVRLRLVGDGELRAAIETQIAALGIGDSVDMMGGRDDIPEQLSQMDIFVLSSKREGFPVAILEAMAAGRSVVATSVGGVREVITHGENGLIVPPENTDALTEALLYLIDHPQEARSMAQKGQKLVSEKFNTASMIASYCKLFEETAGMKRIYYCFN